MLKVWDIIRNYNKVEKVCWKLRKYAESWESMLRVEKVWECMRKYEKAWDNMRKYERVWESMRQYA